MCFDNSSHRGIEINAPYKSIRIKNTPGKKYKKIRTSISKTENTDMNRCSFFINQYRTHSIKYGQK